MKCNVKAIRQHSAHFTVSDIQMTVLSIVQIVARIKTFRLEMLLPGEDSEEVS
jgi:hypothetical protein